MNITPNYQMKTLNFTSGVGQTKQATKTVKQYVAPYAKKLSGPAASALAAIILTKPNLEEAKQTEIKLPTREEFENMIKADKKVNKDFLDDWLEAFDENPANAFKLFNLTNKNGDRYAYSKKYRNEIPDTDADIMEKVLNTTNDLGICPFAFKDARRISSWKFITDYPAGLTQALGLRTESGELRFTKGDDYTVAKAFEEHPVLAIEYAYATDDIGNYRFTGQDIMGFVEAKTSGKYSPEKIDEMLNLRRPDDSYVIKSFIQNGYSLEKTIDAFVNHPKEFEELGKMRIAGEKGYIDCDDIDRIIDSYISYPNETKSMLQKMPRFSAFSISCHKKAVEMFNKAPVSFIKLANMINDEKLYLFDELNDIRDVIEQFDLIETEKTNNPDKLKNTLATIYSLANVRKKCFKMDIKLMREATDIYQKYPKETLYIIEHYIGRSSDDGKWESVVPTEDDIKLYKENPEEFDKKYEKFE